MIRVITLGLCAALLLRPVTVEPAQRLPSYPEQWGLEFKELATSPLFYGSVAAVASLYAASELTGYDNALVPRMSKTPRTALLYTGDVLQFQGVGMAAGHWAADDDRAALAYLDSFLISGLLSLVLKYTVDQRRPRGSGHGFPSGHTTAAASAFGAALGLRDYTAASFLFAGTALTAFSRLVDTTGRRRRAWHTVSQVAAGLILGAVTGFLAGRQLKENYTGSGEKAAVSAARYGRQMPVNRYEFGRLSL